MRECLHETVLGFFFVLICIYEWDDFIQRLLCRDLKKTYSALSINVFKCDYVEIIQCLIVILVGSLIFKLIRNSSWTWGKSPV